MEWRIFCCCGILVLRRQIDPYQERSIDAEPEAKGPVQLGSGTKSVRFYQKKTQANAALTDQINEIGTWLSLRLGVATFMAVRWTINGIALL